MTLSPLELGERWLPSKYYYHVNQAQPSGHGTCRLIMSPLSITCRLLRVWTGVSCRRQRRRDPHRILDSGPLCHRTRVLSRRVLHSFGRWHSGCKQVSVTMEQSWATVSFT